MLFYKIINHFRCELVPNPISDRRSYDVYSTGLQAPIKGAIQDDVVEMGTVPITKNAPFLELSENDDWRLPLSWEASDSLDREDCIEDAYRLIELYLTVA